MKDIDPIHDNLVCFYFYKILAWFSAVYQFQKEADLTRPMAKVAPYIGNEVVYNFGLKAISLAIQLPLIWAPAVEMLPTLYKKNSRTF
jgi:hypothetical protein